MTTSAKRPRLSPPKQIPIQSLLSNATSNHFFLLPNEKKTCLKQLLQGFIQRKNAKKYVLFSLQATQSNIYGWAFLQKELAAKN